MSSDWQSTLNDLLMKIERNTKTTLNEIKKVFQRSDLAFDEKFRKNFLDILNNRVSETYERFEIDTTSFNRVVLNEASSTSTIDTKKRKTNIAPDSNSKDSQKKQKLDFDLDSDSATVPGILFTCVYCSRDGKLYDSVDRVCKHWHSSHSQKSQSFQFYISEIVKCYYCSKTGNYIQLREHYTNNHSSKKPFGIVHQNDLNKCGFCGFESMDLMEHFESVHNIINQLNVFNPMCLSEETVAKLLDIDIHGKRKCEYCSRIYDTKTDLERHHSKEHNGKKLISKFNNNMEVECAHCNERMSNSVYTKHMQAHSYKLKCIGCSFNSTKLNEMVSHAETAHGLRDSIDEFCIQLRDLLMKRYFETKLIFGNGLVLIKHNLLGTKLNDSREFGTFISKFLEAKRAEQDTMLEEQKQNELNAIELQKQNELNAIELQKQNELLNSIIIEGFPANEGNNIRRLFMKLCTLLDVQLTINDIENIHQLNGDQMKICVKFKQNNFKDQLLQMAESNQIGSGDLIDLPPGVDGQLIRIDNYLTNWYHEMQCIANKAIREKKLCCSWISEKGLAVKRTPKGSASFVLSKKQLTDFIERE